jgi:hypothetical protein
MLRKIVKALIPSQDRVFFDLLIEGTTSVEKSAKLLNQLMKEKDKLTISELSEDLRMTRAVAVEVANKIDHELSRHFVTPIDRIELHNITTGLLKLNKRIVKIHRYMQILMEEERSDIDLYLTNSVETLRKMTRTLNDMMKALRDSDYKELKSFNNKLSILDENILEELGHALKKFSHFEGDIMLVMKVKDIYKAVENAISSCSAVGEAIMRVHVKEV